MEMPTENQYMPTNENENAEPYRQIDLEAGGDGSLANNISPDFDKNGNGKVASSEEYGKQISD